MKISAKYFEFLVASMMVVMVVQYALLTGVWSPIRSVLIVLQIFCYLLLAVAVFRGLLQRSRLAWLVAQIMLTAMFSFSLLCTTLSVIFALKTQGIGSILIVTLSLAILDGLLLGFLFSVPVCNYFKSVEEEAQLVSIPQ